MESGSLSPKQIERAYTALLGRMPESEQVVAHFQAVFSSEHDLWNAIVESPEFARILERGTGPTGMEMGDLNKAFWSLQDGIQHDVSPEVMNALVERIRDQWVTLGQTDPHYSVLSHERYRAANLGDDVLAEFYHTGESSAGVIEVFEQRTNVRARRGLCLELGCGVGRVTRFLARMFDGVLALDISPGNLALCDQYMRDAGVTNVETRQIQDMKDFDALPEIDFFYSTIVIQHNSPPIQKAMLRSILRKIRPGGGAMFQIPTDVVGYTFDADAYLSSEAPEFEMHALPKHVVLREIRDAGLDLIDVAPDVAAGSFGSYSFYAVKADA